METKFGFCEAGGVPGDSIDVHSCIFFCRFNDLMAIDRTAWCDVHASYQHAPTLLFVIASSPACKRIRLHCLKTKRLMGDTCRSERVRPVVRRLVPDERYWSLVLGCQTRRREPLIVPCLQEPRRVQHPRCIHALGASLKG